MMGAQKLRSRGMMQNLILHQETQKQKGGQ